MAATEIKDKDNARVISALCGDVPDDFREGDRVRQKHIIFKNLGHRIGIVKRINPSRGWPVEVIFLDAPGDPNPQRPYGFLPAELEHA